MAVAIANWLQKPTFEKATSYDLQVGFQVLKKSHLRKQHHLKTGFIENSNEQSQQPK